MKKKAERAETMDRLRVRSTAVAQVGYNPIEKTLEVAFRGGRVYEYLNVPETTYYQLLLSDSVGRFVNKEIKTTYDVREVKNRPLSKRPRKHTLH